MAGYFLKRGPKIHGPVDNVKVVELAREGKVKPTDEVSTSEEGPWQRADSISALKTLFDQRDAVAAASPSARPAKTGQWFVNISGFAGDKIEGPISSQRIKDLIDENVVNARTQVMHPKETNNEWVALRQTDLITHIEQRKEEKRERKQEAALEKQQVADLVKDAQKESQRYPTTVVEEEYEEFLSGCATRPDSLYLRGDVNCGQCSNSFGEKILLDGSCIKCSNCGRITELPSNRTDFFRDWQRASNDEKRSRELYHLEMEKRTRNYMIFGGFSVLAVVLFYCQRFTEAGHWSNMAVRIGFGSSVCVAMVFPVLIVLSIVRVSGMQVFWKDTGQYE